MAIERTLCIMKPDCVCKGLQGVVLAQIQKAGFKVLGMKQIRLTKEQAGAFYAVHKERPFYPSLVEFMTSGAVVTVALEKENAIAITLNNLIMFFIYFFEFLIWVIV